MTTIDTTAPVAPETKSAPEVKTSPGQEESAGVQAVTPAKKSRRGRKVALLAILLVIFGLLFAWYLFNRKPFSELPGLNVAKVPHYQFSIYDTSKPLGVAVTASGDRIYVTEGDGERVVRVFNGDGKPAGTLKPPASTGAAHTPVYVAINPITNDVYVSDRLTVAVYIYNAEGKYLRTFAPKGDLGGGWAPLGLAFSANGSLYATDVSGDAHRVLAFRPDGTLLRSLGTPGQLSFPNGIVVDARGNIAVSDSNNGRLVVFNPDGKMLATISRGIGEGDLGLPRGTAVDDSDRLFVVDTADHMVRIYDTSDKKVPTPAFIGAFGGEGQQDGMFQYPNGIATDTRAHIYITDRENNRVQVWGY